MPIQQACIQCPNCGRYTVLPPRSHLGTFDNEASPSKDIWPINYLCLRCGQLSVIPAQTIRSARPGKQDQYQVVRYDFASVQSGTLRHIALYTREKTDSSTYRIANQAVADEAVENVLKPSGLWQESYGDRVNVSIDWGLEHPIPVTLEDIRNRNRPKALEAPVQFLDF
ncbi:MAG: hypothetical protein WBE76_21780 [Terracidiphilus sp.]